MVLRYLAGETLQEIGNSYEVSREFVRQRIQWMGLDPKAGGKAAQTLMGLHDRIAKKKATQDAIEDRHFKRWGMTREQYRALPGSELDQNDCRNPKRAFTEQRRNAKTRGVGWELSFADWWRIWQESGHWNERGRGEGYCMARWGDSGPYSVDNVYICTIGQNFSDHWIVRRQRKTIEAHQ